MLTISDVQDLVEILERYPEWHREVRRIILTDELLTLPDTLRELAEAQKRTEEQVAALAEAQRRSEERISRLEATVQELIEAQKRTEEQVAALAEAQRRSEERISRLEATVQELIEAQKRTEERLDRLEEIVADLVQTVDRLSLKVEIIVDVQKHMLEDLGKLKGGMMEIQYWRKAPAYFGSPFFRRIRVVPPEQVADWLEDAMERDEMSWDERKAVMDADLVVRGLLPDGEEAYLLVEISWGIGVEDIQRAVERAAILGKVVRRAFPAVAGHWATEDAKAMARSYGVVQITDGYALWPEERLTGGG